MKNRDYWRRRFEILEASAINKGHGYLATLDREYKTAMKNVEAELSTWYQRFAGNNGISLAEAKQLLNKGQLAEFKWSVEDYIKYGQENALNRQWMKQLENASAKVHVTRLQALQIEMQQKIEVLYGNQLDGLDGLARKIYTEGYYHTAFEVQKGFNIGWDLTPLNQKQLDRVITKPWTLDKETFSDRIWKQKNALLSKVQTEMTQSLLRGDSPDKAIGAISKQFNVSKNQAGRLVMTESAYFASESQKDCFNALDVERFEIVATLDSHTSDLCQSLDGHVELMKDYEAGVTAPPFHPWCRTTTVPYFEDNFGERAARGADGKTYYVPSNMKYGDWKKTFVDGGSKTTLKPGDESVILKLENCKTAEDVESLMKSQGWFNAETLNGKLYDSNEALSLKGCDLEAAKQVYIAHEEVFDKYPQLVGKLNAVNSASLKQNTYANCHVGFGRGGITINSKKYADSVKLAESYLRDVASGYHPAGTDWTSIVTHELGHALDDYLTNKLRISGMRNHWQPKWVSADLRPKVMRASGFKVADAYKEVSGYATKDHFEWFAECFAEYIKSDSPRTVATEFGKVLDEIMKGVK